VRCPILVCLNTLQDTGPARDGTVSEGQFRAMMRGLPNPVEQLKPLLGMACITNRKILRERKLWQNI
jgi:hypothetical protein